jgi:[ribosomal protein S5]-alanine N-acetyltransferase
VRAIRPADAQDLERMFHDPRVNRYLPYERRKESGRTFVARARRLRRVGQAYRFVIRRRGSGAFVGSIGLFGISRRDRSAELGYALAHRQWGRGYATEAVAVVLTWAFGTLRLHRVEALVEPQNPVSIQILRRMGFRREGRRREVKATSKGYVDLLQFGLLESEFRAHQSRTAATRRARTRR